MKYIEFMQYSPNELYDKKPVLINLEQVAKIYPSGNMTCVSLAGEGEITILRNDYEEVIRRISEVNDRQFCLDRKPMQPKPFDEQKIVSVEAIYTGGGIWNYMGQIEDGSFFFAMDDTYYDVIWLDADPRKAGEDAWLPEWQEEHKLNESCDCVEVFSFFRNLYRSIPESEFADKKRYIEDLEDYIGWYVSNC